MAALRGSCAVALSSALADSSSATCASAAGAQKCTFSATKNPFLSFGADSLLPPPRQPVKAPLSRAVVNRASAPVREFEKAALVAWPEPPKAISKVKGGQAERQGAAIPRGDTAGAVLVMDDVAMSVGGQDLLRDVEWRVVPGQRVGIVGPNGAGKSTLLKALTGKLPIDGGRIAVGENVHVGYLEQTAVSGSNSTVWEEASSRMTAVNEAAAELAAAESALERDDSTPALECLAAAQERFMNVGGYSADQTIAGVLKGLGFSTEDWGRKCSEFSGGWQMRIALARLLLSIASAAAGGVSGNDTLLLLDEPTNHLDASARKWLASHLKSSPGACIVVTHDEQLLDGMGCERIAEVAGQTLHHYACSYSKFLEERQFRKEQALREFEAQQEEIQRLQGFVDRFGAKASKASSAQSRKKMLDKIVRVEAPPEDQKARKVIIKLPNPPPSYAIVLKLKDMAVGWDEHRGPLLKNVTLQLMKGQRMVILGPNGCGKSTLLHTMAGGAGTPPPCFGGEREAGQGVEIGVFTQDLAQDLPQGLTGLQYVMQVAMEKDPNVTFEKARAALGALGLSGEAALRPISALSGGEKARVALAGFVLRPYNVLLLDEPSNHLDRGTIQALTQALRGFKGAMVVVSHDRDFCSELEPTHVARVHPGGRVTTHDCIGGELRPQDFDYTKWEKVAAEGPKPTPRVAVEVSRASEVTAGKAKKAGTGGGGDDVRWQEAPAKMSRFEWQKRSKQVAARIEKLVAALEQGEALAGVLDEEMAAAGSDAGKALAVLEKKNKLVERIADIEKEWEEKEAEAEELQKIQAACGY